MKKEKLFIIPSLLLVLNGCAQTPKEEYVLHNKTKLECGFDTVCRLDAFVTSEEEFMNYYNVMVDDFAHYNELFDIYHNYDGVNNIKTINDNAGIKEVEVDQSIIDLLLLAKDISELSNGAFDITNGALLKVWHNYRDRGEIDNENGKYGAIPKIQELETVKDYRGFDHIIIDDDKNTVFIDNENISLDVGGIGKGFAVEKVANHLEELGLKYGSVNGGGNQRMIGTKADGNGWGVGVQDPRTANGIIAVLPNQVNVSVVTSGDYQNYYLAENDQRISHIIDPETLFPANQFNSVSIAVNNSGLADCLSTALYILDYEEGLKFIDAINQKYNTDIIVVWISDEPLDDSSIKSVSEVEQYITVTDNFKDKLITK